MKKILLQVSSASLAHNAIFKEDINNTTYRWRELKHRLSGLGYDLTTADDNPLTDCAGIIFHDASSMGNPPDIETGMKNALKRLFGINHGAVYPTGKLYEEAMAAGLADKAILLIWEGKTICPSNFYPSTWEKFSRILTWDDDLLTGSKFTKYFMPIDPPRHIPKTIPFHDKKLLVNISRNRYSPSSGELYSERRKSIRFFEKRFPNDFDLYGMGWNKPASRYERIFPWLTHTYAAYRGITHDKLDTLSRYRFSLCYENNADAKGYISEKIFDNFHAGTVPIYWGASNITDYVPADAFIDRRKFKSHDDLASFIRNMNKSGYAAYLEAARRFLKSEKYSFFMPENFINTMIHALRLQKIL